MKPMFLPGMSYDDVGVKCSGSYKPIHVCFILHASCTGLDTVSYTNNFYFSKHKRTGLERMLMLTVSHRRMSQCCIHVDLQYIYDLMPQVFPALILFVFLLRFHKFFQHSRQASTALNQYPCCYCTPAPLLHMCCAICWVRETVCNCVRESIQDFVCMCILTLIDLEKGLR